MIRDGDVVTISSSSGLGCPDKVLAAIGERFEAEGAPRKLTTLHPIAAGDMYGIQGIDHIAKPGLLARVLAGSYPSGPSSLPMPAIWRMVVDNEVQAYNIPSGILFDMHRDAAARRPGVLTTGRPRHLRRSGPQGCAMNEAAAEHAVVRKVELRRAGMAVLPGRRCRTSRSSARPPPMSAATSPTNTKARCSAASTRRSPHATTAASSLRRSSASSGRQRCGRTTCTCRATWSTTSSSTRSNGRPRRPSYDPAISGEIQQPLATFEPQEWGPEKVIARRAAMELAHGHAVNLGFGISANVPRILLEEGLHGEVTWAIEQGAVGGMPLLGFAFGCASNADAILPRRTSSPTSRAAAST